jgi:Tfp pilus assembly protein PilF
LVAEPKPASEQPGKDVAPRRAHSAALDKKTLADELAAVELARRALARKDPAQCLRLLDEYSRRFSPRRLDAEAIMLRIEALSASGDRATAQRLGQSFLAKHPQGPYARRVRSLIGLTPEP